MPYIISQDTYDSLRLSFYTSLQDVWCATPGSMVLEKARLGRYRVARSRVNIQLGKIARSRASVQTAIDGLAQESDTLFAEVDAAWAKHRVDGVVPAAKIDALSRNHVSRQAFFKLQELDAQIAEKQKKISEMNKEERSAKTYLGAFNKVLDKKEAEDEWKQNDAILERFFKNENAVIEDDPAALKGSLKTPAAKKSANGQRFVEMHETIPLIGDDTQVDEPEGESADPEDAERKAKEESENAFIARLVERLSGAADPSAKGADEIEIDIPSLRGGSAVGSRATASAVIF